MPSLAAQSVEALVGLVYGLGMRFGNSRARSAAVDFVSGGWWLPTQFREALNLEADSRGREIAAWMRQHPNELDGLARPNRQRFFAVAAEWGLSHP